MAKRAFDLLISLTGLVLLFPLFILTAVAIKLDSPGPVFFRGQRMGRGGRLFRIYKLRSMTAYADQRGPGITTADDNRITRVGRILRKTKLDELPQLINVVRGEMSLVGPRPEDPRYVALYTPEQRRALNVRPGVTSLASIKYRDEEHILTQSNLQDVYVNKIMPEKLMIELDYLQKQTFWRDLGVLAATFGALFHSGFTRRRPRWLSTGQVLNSAAGRREMTHSKRPIIIRNRYLVIIDLLFTALSAVLGFAIRLDVPLFWTHLPLCIPFTLMAIALKLPVYYFFGLYRRYWRYASVSEMLIIFAATTTSSLILSLLILGLFLPRGWLSGFPRSALIIDWLWSLFFIGGIRFSVRFLGEFGPLRSDTGQSFANGRPRRVLIVGAGDAGAMIVREMRSNPHIGMEPVGYVDDNQAKVGMHIHGLPVLGTRAYIPELVRRFKIDHVLIAMPTAPGIAIRQIKEICESVPVPFKTIPGMYELLDGTVQISQIRDVQIEDLLRRDPVHIRADDAPYLYEKVTLVTGAGGSIGSELCRQVAYRHPKQLVLLGHGENSIYLIHRELSNQFPNLELKPVIADVRNKAHLQRIFQAYHPQVVFHAAAHKHVPMMELNLEEAVSNNVLGTRNMLEIAEQFGAERFVLISSDKAVNPANIMGATKRIAELMVQDIAHRSGHNFVAVRFGNVLGSRGSVVPLFKQQIATGGPVTVTHPDMERYFMTIPEAVYLVLQASSLGSGGELFVLDMGEPVKIVDLARDLITLSGLQPGRDIEIKFIGVRPGEKLQERLFLTGEEYEPTSHGKVFVCKSHPPLERQALQFAVRQLIQLAQQSVSAEEIWTAVKVIVPECTVNLKTLQPKGDYKLRSDLGEHVPVPSVS